MCTSCKSYTEARETVSLGSKWLEVGQDSKPNVGPQLAFGHTYSFHAVNYTRLQPALSSTYPLGMGSCVC